MSVVDLLADKLIDKNAEKINSVEKLKKEGCILAFYFAASWCEPCLAFTQLLISFYEDMLLKYEKKKVIKDTKNFEVIFVSSDLNEEGFSESIKEVPWMSISYKHCQLRKKISKKYNVKEIPCLALVEGWSGKTINTKGRDALLEDINGDSFPWRRPSLAEVMGTRLMLHGEMVDCTERLKGAYLGVYFSAHWCPPCRLLTSHLTQVYNHLKTKVSSENHNRTLSSSSSLPTSSSTSSSDDHYKFEVVFVSSDRSQDSFDEHSREMPWLVLPFQDERTRPLTKFFDVSGIPTLILLNPSHDVICLNARSAVFNDPKAQFFPWSSEQPEELTESSIEHLGTTPCLILFTEGRSDLIEKARELLTSSASAYMQACRLSREDALPLPPIRLFYEGAQSDEVADSLRSFAQIEGREPVAVVVVEGGEVLRGVDNQLDPPAIEALLEKFKMDWIGGGEGE